MRRQASISRKTEETQIDLSLDLDGTGRAEVSTGIPFLDHMLASLAKHGRFNLELNAKGDLEVDPHHTVEDVGIVLGQTFRKALGDKRGIVRFGGSLMVMDEALALVALDLSGRSRLEWDVEMPAEMIGTYDTGLTHEFMHAFVNHAALTLHVKTLAGGNTHHMIEAVFKGLARALEAATRQDPRMAEEVPSTKGELE
ncbi:MAG: imidazoleglycerol-phosphate dehydratase HisB [Actinobacteria bacterium]|nr:MAG: imidazoleglycerol-phosphate dehydratase HisB [Actinomycetota bacterium]